MATVQRYVNTASTAGGDGTTNATTGANRAYASLFEWEANAGGSATDDYIVDCCGTAADTTAVVINFAVDITTGSITIRGNRSDPAGFYDGPLVISDQHYRLNAGPDALLCNAEGNVTIDGIQVIPTGSDFRVGIGVVGSTSGTGVVVRNCRVFTTSGTRTGIGASVSVAHNNSVLYENNLIVGFQTSGIEYISDSFRSPTVTIRHNTIYGDGSSGGIRLGNQANGGGTWTIKANAIANNGAGNDIIASFPGTATVTYADNACQNAEGTTDEIVLGTTTDAWTSPGTSASSDFTVKDTSSSLYNAVNPTLLTLDITGFTRDGTNHDVGCFEFQSGGDPDPNEGSGTASATGAAEGEGYTEHYGSGTSTATATAEGEGYTEHYGSGTASATGAAVGTGEAPADDDAAEGSGVATATGSAVGEGYTLHYGSGTASAVGSAVGEGYRLSYGSGAASAVGSAVGGGPSADIGISIPGGVKKKPQARFLRRASKDAPRLPWELEDEPITVAPTKRKRIQLPPAKVQEALGPIPIQTVREISAPVISIPSVGTAVLEDDEDDDFLWLI